MAKKQKVQKSLGRNILEWVLTLLAAVAIALVIRTFVFEPVRVEGASMNDTLADKEIMIVTKFDFSSTWLSMPWQNDQAKQDAARFTVGGNPERFDVVICRYPGRGDTNFVKRVVGLPGETVELREGYLYIDGVKYEEEFLNDAYRVRGGSNGYSFGPYQVPEGYYFVMGDHRNNSNDSRSIGAITRDSIIGHVRWVVFPFSQIRGVD